MMTAIWTIVIVFAGVSLFTGNPAPLIAGVILAAIGIVVERFYK